jgi:Flp pilus assembly protein TadD
MRLHAPQSRQSRTTAAGESRRARLLELALGVIQRLAADRPLMFVVEDLHWADRSTLDLVAARAGLTRNVYGIYLTFNLAESLFRLGRWGEAVRHLTDTVDSGIASQLAGSLLQLRGTIAVLQGRFEDAEADIREARQRRADGRFTLQVVFARAELARARGDIESARESVVDELAESGWETPRYRWPLVWLGLRLEAEAADRRRSA